MDKAFIFGLMGESTKEPMKTIKSMDLEFISGRMVGNTKAIGKMVNSMEVDSSLKGSRKRREFGIKGKE